MNKCCYLSINFKTSYLSAGKEFTCMGLILGLGKCPGGGNGNLLQYSCQRKTYGQRNLMG